ncbi:MAG: hypothetical protein LBJ00_17710 [Planctomycetaceae bacterium]|nr:hypothetical protein [Planctomycetaceae bacterium]
MKRLFRGEAYRLTGYGISISSRSGSSRKGVLYESNDDYVFVIFCCGGWLCELWQ